VNASIIQYDPADTYLVIPAFNIDSREGEISNIEVKVKGKGRYSSSWEPHLRAYGTSLAIWDHSVKEMK